MIYILSGNPNDVRKVIQENRIRIRRGVIKFTPLEGADPHDIHNPIDDGFDLKDEPDVDTKSVPEADVKSEPEMVAKEEPNVDTKTIKAKRTKKSE